MNYFDEDIEKSIKQINDAFKYITQFIKQNEIPPKTAYIACLLIARGLLKNNSEDSSAKNASVLIMNGSLDFIFSPPSNIQK